MRNGKKSCTQRNLYNVLIFIRDEKGVGGGGLEELMDFIGQMIKHI
jgi:hypothetical protein